MITVEAKGHIYPQHDALLDLCVPMEHHTDSELFIEMSRAKRVNAAKLPLRKFYGCAIGGSTRRLRIRGQKRVQSRRGVLRKPEGL